MTKKILKTQTYLWTGTNKRGVKTKGEIFAASSGIAKAELTRQGFNVKKIHKKLPPLFASRSSGKKIKPIDIILFTRNLSTILKAGLPIVQAFDIIENGQENPNMQKLIASIKTDIISGNTIATALSKHPQYFEELYCSLISVGEKSGTLIKMLERIELYLDRSYHLKKKVKKAMFYPIIIIIVAFVVSLVLLIGVVPKFKSMFESFGSNLPSFTQGVVDLSVFVRSYWWIIIMLITGMTIAFHRARRNSIKFAEWLDNQILKLPTIGPLTKKIIIARFARILTTTVSSGMPIVEAMQEAANVMGNCVYKKAVERMRDEVSTGQTLQLTMANTQLFPNLVVQMVAVGEESGVLDDMLTKIAIHYENDVDSTVDNLSTLLEPVIMAVLGLIVGSFIAAMYLPIFRLGSVV